MHSTKSVVELPEFQKKASDLFCASEISEVVNHLATNPKSGDLIQGTGGIRKLRWSAKGRGKRGGVRIIYYFHNKTIPLFLLTAFPKNEKPNLTKSERNELAKLSQLLINNYGDKDE